MKQYLLAVQFDERAPAPSERELREQMARTAEVTAEMQSAGSWPSLAAVDELDLPGYHLLPATRADLLTRLGRTADAVAAYDEAITLAANDAERTFLRARRARLIPDA